MSDKFSLIKVRAWRHILAAMTLALLGAPSLQSQIVIKQRPQITRPVAAGTPATAKTSGPVIKWNNGESLDGELVGATANDLTWKSPVFNDPLVLSLSYLNSVELPQLDKEPGEPFMVTLRSGDRLFGKLTALDEKTVTMNSECHGETILLRPEVASLHRLQSKELIYSGPVPGAPWRVINDRYANNGNKRQVWNMGEGGWPVLSTWNGINFLPLALPDSVEVSFHLHSTALPQFRAYLNANYDASPSIETWDDMLVLVLDGHFALLRKMDPSERDVQLRVCWNKKEKHCAVFTMEGEKIAELDTKDAVVTEKPVNKNGGAVDPFEQNQRMAMRPQGKPEAGFSLHNIGINLMLQSLRVKEWSGQPPPKLKLDDQRVELAAGGVAIGNVVRADASGIVVQSTGAAPTTYPLNEVEAVVFTGAPQPSKRTNTELQFADGAFLSGTLLEIKDGTASIQSAASANPVLSKIASLKQIRLRVPAAAGAPPEPPLAELDRLVLAKNTLHGTPVGSGDAQLRWMPVGGLRPIGLAEGTDTEMIRGIKPGSPVNRASSLFYLKNGDILPGELKGMDEKFVDLHSTVSNVNRLPAANFHAIQFSSPDFNADGFTDPGWRIIRGGIASVVLADNKLTLKTGGAFGHPSVLQADELKFEIKAQDGYGAVRLKFFVNDINSPAKSISMMLMHSGNEIYCGQESNDGQFEERAQMAVTYNKPVQVKLVLNENNIEVFINDMPIHKMAALPAKRTGLGLVIEPADIWGNGEREIVLSNFSAHVNLERGWFPAIDPEAKTKALFVPRFRREDLPTHVLVAANGDLLRGHIESVSPGEIRVRSGMETVNVPRNRVSAAIWLLPPDKNAPKNPEPKKEVEKNANEEQAAKFGPGGIRIQGGAKIRIGGGAVIVNAAGPNAAVIVNGNNINIAGGVVQLNGGENIPDDTAPSEKSTTVEGSGNAVEATPGFTPTHWLQLRDGGRIALAVDKFEADKLTGHSPLLGSCEIPLDRIHIVRFKSPGPTPALLAYQNWRLEPAPEPVLPESGGQSSPTLGKEVKDFRLPMLGGGDFVFGNEKGKVIVLDFWATWCGPCVQSLPGLIEAMKPFDAKRVKFIGVNQGEEAAQVKRFLEQRGWKFAVALDATQSVAQQFGVTGIPHTVIIGPNGKIAWVNTGYRPGAEKDAVNAVNKLLEGGNPK